MDNRHYYKEIEPNLFVAIVNGHPIRLGAEKIFFGNDYCAYKFREESYKLPDRTIRIRYVDMGEAVDWTKLGGGIIYNFNEEIPCRDVIKYDGTICKAKEESTCKNEHIRSLCDFLNTMNLGYRFDTARTHERTDDNLDYRIVDGTSYTAVGCFYDFYKCFLKQTHIPTKIGKRLPFGNKDVIVINKNKEPLIILKIRAYSNKVLWVHKNTTFYHGAFSYYMFSANNAVDILNIIGKYPNTFGKHTIKNLMIGICLYYKSVCADIHVSRKRWNDILHRLNKSYYDIDLDEDLSQILISLVFTKSKQLLKNK